MVGVLSVHLIPSKEDEPSSSLVVGHFIFFLRFKSPFFFLLTVLALILYGEFETIDSLLSVICLKTYS